ncbi:MAG: 3-oxoacyl-[acyl-carrier-protein] synthase III C-terminal domain-containing protein [Cyanobacteria bacterium P01_A01_bin.83]
MTNHSIGISSLALSFPKLIRTNDYWCHKFPELTGKTRNKRRRLTSNSSTHKAEGLKIWSQEVAPYLDDPFRGNVERRVLSQDESSLMLEYQAAQEAMAAAKLKSQDVELIISTSLFSQPFKLGNAALTSQLNLSCPAWNLESTCSSALIALQNARALVQTGEYRNVLVVVSQSAANTVDDSDTLSWSMGDGAGAFMVSSLPRDQGILSSKIISTAITHGAYTHQMVVDARGQPRIQTQTGDNTSMLAETAVDSVRTCCEKAAAAAGLSLNDIDFFAFNTPTPWYASVCVRALNIDQKRVINLYPRYANIGLVFPIANLYHATQSGKLKENDLVLVYTNGAGATAGAIVMRWGDVALGAVPASPMGVTPEQEAIHLAKVDSGEELDSKVEVTSLTKQQLLAAKPEVRQQMLETYLLQWFCNSLRLSPEELTAQQSCSSLLDSLLALMLKSQIESDLGLQVSMENFLGNNTIAQLGDQLLKQLALANLAASVTTAANQEEEREKLSL